MRNHIRCSALAAIVATAGMTFGAAQAAVLCDPRTGHALGITDVAFDGDSCDVHFRCGSDLDANAALGAIAEIPNAEPAPVDVAAGVNEILWVVTSVVTARLRAPHQGGSV